MNENEFDLAARAWLNEGPTRMSDRAVLSTLDQVHTTRQRRTTWQARRATSVSNFAGLSIAVVLGVAVGVVGTTVVQRQPDDSGVGGSSPSAIEAVDFPKLTQTFVSPRNGFSIKHPGRASLTPATQLWMFSEQVDDGFDVVETGLSAVFKGASTEFQGGFSGTCRNWCNERIDEYLSDNYVLPGNCSVPRSQQAEITIDGQSGRIAECPNQVEATVVAGGRLYFFALLHDDRTDARAVFEAFVATIDLTPETAIDFPGLTTTFVSPTYGYSFKYHDRGGLAPATELWDPVNQQLDDIDFPNRFDAVETGFSNYFEAASTPIPDGVSIDEWVDEYVTARAAGGCGVPRSRQAQVTIDGQPGRIAECANRIEATVVAGGRLYVFIGGNHRAWFDAWVATVDLTPETAAVR